MKILLVSNYPSDRQESMLRFASALHEGLLRAGIEAEVIRPEPLFGRIRRGASGLAKWLGYVDKFAVFPLRLRRRASSADLIHICDQSNSMYLSHTGDRPHVVTCNDLLAIRSAAGELPQHRTRATGRVLQQWILASLKRASHVICISEATRSDVIRLTGLSEERITVAYMGQNYPYAPIPEVFKAAEDRRCRRNFDITVFRRHGLPDEPYLLHVGGSQWYKNREGLLSIYKELNARLGGHTPRLVMVGPALKTSMPRVDFHSGVSNESLAAFYSGAELLLFPSLAEGFGWPIIEAQACGCRAITTGKAPMTEVGGSAAFYLEDPADATAGATMVAEVLEQPVAERVESVAAGIANASRFSTDRMVREYIAIYRKLIGK